MNTVFPPLLASLVACCGIRLFSGSSRFELCPVWRKKLPRQDFRFVPQKMFSLRSNCERRTNRTRNHTVLLTRIRNEFWKKKNHITKRLNSCVNRFYSFVNAKVIFQNTRRIKFFSTDHNSKKSFIKTVAGTAMIFSLGKRNEDFTTGKRIISKPFRKVIPLLPLLITLKQLVTTWNGTISTFWRPAKLATIVRLRRTCLCRSCSQHWRSM